MATCIATYIIFHCNQFESFTVYLLATKYHTYINWYKYFNITLDKIPIMQIQVRQAILFCKLL